jgi:hypothetical protein
MSYYRPDQKQAKLAEVMLTLDQTEGLVPSKPLALSEPNAQEFHRQTRKVIDDIAHYQRLRETDIDTVFPDKRASAWLRGMHMLTEVASRMYEQNPYEYSKLEEVAQSLHLIEDYIKRHRHCPAELRKNPKTLN